VRSDRGACGTSISPRRRVGPGTGCQTDRVRREYEPPTREILEGVGHRVHARARVTGGSLDALADQMQHPVSMQGVGTVLDPNSWQSRAVTRRVATVVEGARGQYLQPVLSLSSNRCSG
jgi:hypothetical protein